MEPDNIINQRGFYDSRVELLFDMISKINTRKGVAAILDTVMEACKTIMNAQAGSLMLVSQNGEELVISVPIGPMKSEITGQRIPVGSGISGWVARNREPVIVNDVSADPRFEGEIRSEGFITRNLICVPMINNDGRLIGVIQAVNKVNGEEFSENELPLLMMLANQAAICIEREYWYRKAMDRERMDEQVKMARVIQTGFFPDVKPGIENIDIAGTSIPATYVGGDYYDYIKLSDNKWGIAIADVTGKGVPAAMLMSNLRAQMRSLSGQNECVRDVVNAVNSSLLNETGEDTYITLFYGCLEDREFTYTNAGHNPPLVYDIKTDSFQELTDGGPLLGFIDNPGYKEGRISLKPDKVMVLYTDGITEAENIDQDQFGELRLKKIIRNHHSESADEIMNKIILEVNQFRGKAAQSDDETLVILKVGGNE